MTTIQLNIGKGIELAVDPSRFNNEVREHIMKIGLKNLLGDSHAGVTQKAHPTDFVEKSREAAERKLQGLYDGVVRTQSAGNGIAKVTDPVALVILRLARKAVQRDKAKDLAAASKTDRLALLNKLAQDYATKHDADLRPRAVKIVQLENDEPEVAKPVAKPAPVKTKGKK
jgi:hypothetical protein